MNGAIVHIGFGDILHYLNKEILVRQKPRDMQIFLFSKGQNRCGAAIGPVNASQIVQPSCASAQANPLACYIGVVKNNPLHEQQREPDMSQYHPDPGVDTEMDHCRVEPQCIPNWAQVSDSQYEEGHQWRQQAKTPCRAQFGSAVTKINGRIAEQGRQRAQARILTCILKTEFWRKVCAAFPSVAPSHDSMGQKNRAANRSQKGKKRLFNDHANKSKVVGFKIWNRLCSWSPTMDLVLGRIQAGQGRIAFETALKVNNS
ncbi:hypothetical protein [Shimia gijangensis]|uniref:hypothetical protein n=1 Tax=Shimia gijangensis TaxID=1470563 RepID=UPI001114C3B7|nr:hypothetical protein [Shimia gijangensis]